MIEVVPKADLTVDGIRLIRTLCSLSIAEIRSAARQQSPVISIEAFGSDWDSERETLRDIAQIYLNGGASMFFVQNREAENDVDRLTPEALVETLKGLRRIELETQRHTDLENGYIPNPEAFVPHDEDWT